MTNQVNIFYSWQSDIGDNTQKIRKALNNFKSNYDEKSKEIIINEATTREAGSPDIVKCIYDKIKFCDIFICDVTIVNSNCENRKTPNPNVLIELGYAAAIIGWERIILLFNTEYGEIEELPFDIRHHRVTKFRNKTVCFDKSIFEYINCIIEKDPTRPVDSMYSNPEAEQKKRKDSRNLYDIMSTLDIFSMGYFIENYPSYFLDKILDFHEDFKYILNAGTFHIYDEELSEKLKQFERSFDACLNHGECYDYQSLSKEGKYIGTKYNLMHRKVSESKIQQLFTLRNDLKSDYHKLLEYIHKNYTELDLKKTSEIAIISHQKFKKIMAANFSDS